MGQVLVIPHTENTSTPPKSTTYTVKAGDTLYRIGLRYGVSANQLAAVNNIMNKNLIRVGQVLTIPVKGAPSTPPTSTIYTVKAGDTLYSIAHRHGTTVRKIANANLIANLNFILAGTVLVIPK